MAATRKKDSPPPIDGQPRKEKEKRPKKKTIIIIKGTAKEEKDEDPVNQTASSANPPEEEGRWLDFIAWNGGREESEDGIHKNRNFTSGDFTGGVEFDTFRCVGIFLFVFFLGGFSAWEVGRWGGGRKKIENGWRATRRLRLSRSAAGAFAEGGRVRGGFSLSGRFGEDALGAGQN